MQENELVVFHKDLVHSMLIYIVKDVKLSLEKQLKK